MSSSEREYCIVYFMKKKPWDEPDTGSGVPTNPPHRYDDGDDKGTSKKLHLLLECMLRGVLEVSARKRNFNVSDQTFSSFCGFLVVALFEVW